jgi:choline dehydrogenase-like flavoprotein
MVVNAKEIQFVENKVFDADICIVGAGIAGITIAREFLNTNKKVVVLESGGRKPEDEVNELTTGKNTGLPYFELEETRARAFGGSSHYWVVDILNDEINGVRLRGLDGIDFEKKDWIPYSGWPILKQDLDPFYEKAHEVFKIGPYSYSPSDWYENTDSTCLTFSKKLIETTIFQFARKNIFYEDYYREIGKAENITLILNATALNIETTENAENVTAISAICDDFQNFKVKAKLNVIAAGGLENARLLLLSKDVINNGLGNQHDLVGRFFMEHPHQWNEVGTYYPSESAGYRNLDTYGVHYRYGTPVMGYLTLNNQLLKEEKLLNATVGIDAHKYILTPRGLSEAKIGLKNIAKILKRGRPLNNLSKDLQLFLQNLDTIIYEIMRRSVRGDLKKWNRYGEGYTRVNVKYMSEQEPNPESRVLLGSEKDKYGQNKILLDWKVTENDLRSIKKSLTIIDRELQNDNLGYLEIDFSDLKPSRHLHGGYHHMGTTRMSSNPHDGVVNEHCRLHGTNNLFIAGSSVFPTCGYANPTLTIVALSLKLAEYFKKNFQD